LQVAGCRLQVILVDIALNVIVATVINGIVIAVVITSIVLWPIVIATIVFTVVFIAFGNKDGNSNEERRKSCAELSYLIYRLPFSRRGKSCAGTADDIAISITAKNAIAVKDAVVVVAESAVE